MLWPCPTGSNDPFDGERLFTAISATFRHRGTRSRLSPPDSPKPTNEDPARALQWQAFVRRSPFTEQPDDLKQPGGKSASVWISTLVWAAGEETLPVHWPARGAWEGKLDSITRRSS